MCLFDETYRIFIRQRDSGRLKVCSASLICLYYGEFRILRWLGTIKKTHTKKQQEQQQEQQQHERKQQQQQRRHHQKTTTAATTITK